MKNTFDCLEEEAIFHDILSRLDVFTVARSRLVSRSWYAASTSPYFLRLYAMKSQAQSQQPWVVVTVSYKGLQTARLWRPFSGLEIRPTSLPPRPDFVASCSSNGLVCGLWNCDLSVTIVAVGNPIRNIWKQLEPLKAAANMVEKIELDPATGCYRVAVLHESTTKVMLTVSQLSSESGFWLAGDAIPAFRYGGYVLVTEDKEEAFYDMETMGWKRRQIEGAPVKIMARGAVEDWPGCYCNVIKVFDYGDRQIMTTEMSVSNEDIVGRRAQLGVGVWEWDGKGRGWFEVAKVQIGDLLGDRWAHVICAHGGWRTYLIGDVVVFGSRSWPPVAYHLVENKWEVGVTEEDIDMFGKLAWNHVFHPPAVLCCSYAFVPSLTAVP